VAAPMGAGGMGFKPRVDHISLTFANDSSPLQPWCVGPGAMPRSGALLNIVTSKRILSEY